jgi:asparagine synthase (glutamine-hydrolysing)
VCGIVALYAHGSNAEPVDREELGRIRDHMTPRGPDGEGSWFSDDGRVGLGHRRLAIIDLSERGRQPMLSEDGSLAITFNGEIYNYQALRAQLEAEGHQFASTSDTEVLLRLYQARGERMLDELRGMFAFALWDARRGAMWLARDPFGIKPLYYADDGQTLRVASQVKSLVAGGRISRQTDNAATVGFYLFGSVPEPHTILRDVRALPAGAHRWCDGDGLGPERRHFHLPTELVRLRTTTPIGTVRDAVTDSVAHHMIADVPVGAFLSSGIDSCTLVSLMQAASRETLRTLTLSFDELANNWIDETPLAEKAAALYATEHRTRKVTRDEFEQDLPRILDAMDQPSIDGINTWFVSKATRELGLKVAVSGLGADELFGGYGSTFGWIPKWQPRLSRVAAVPFVARAWQRMWRMDRMRRGLGLSRKIGDVLAYGHSYPGAYLLRRGVFMPWELDAVMAPDALEDGLRRLDPMRHIDEAMRPDPGSDYTRVAALEAGMYMKNQLLRDSDWASMAHSLELRVPFVDIDLWRRVVPLVASAPIHRTDKRQLADVATPRLPDGVFERPKTGFYVPVQDWIASMNDGALDAWRSNATLSAPDCHWSRRLAFSLVTPGG